jgi:hypothetical protein
MQRHDLLLAQASRDLQQLFLTQLSQLLSPDIGWQTVGPPPLVVLLATAVVVEPVATLLATAVVVGPVATLLATAVAEVSVEAVLPLGLLLPVVPAEPLVVSPTDELAVSVAAMPPAPVAEVAPAEAVASSSLENRPLSARQAEATIAKMMPATRARYLLRAMSYPVARAAAPIKGVCCVIAAA